MLLTWLTCYLKGRKSCLHLDRFNTAANANKSVAYARLYKWEKSQMRRENKPATGRSCWKDCGWLWAVDCSLHVVVLTWATSKCSFTVFDLACPVQTSQLWKCFHVLFGFWETSLPFNSSKNTLYDLNINLKLHDFSYRYENKASGW